MAFNRKEELTCREPGVRLFGALPESACRDRGLLSKYRVLVAIASRDHLSLINRTKEGCWASVETLAEQCKLDRSTVFRAIHLLIADGYIVRDDRFVASRKRRVYRVVYPKLEEDGGVAPAADTVATDANSSRNAAKHGIEIATESDSDYTQTRTSLKNIQEGSSECGSAMTEHLPPFTGALDDSLKLSLIEAHLRKGAQQPGMEGALRGIWVRAEPGSAAEQTADTLLRSLGAWPPKEVVCGSD